MHETAYPVQCPSTGPGAHLNPKARPGILPSAGSHVLSVTASFLHGRLSARASKGSSSLPDRPILPGPTATQFPVCANERGLTSRPLQPSAARTHCTASFLSANFCPHQGSSSQRMVLTTEPLRLRRLPWPHRTCPPCIPLLAYTGVNKGRRMQVQSFEALHGGGQHKAQGKRWVSSSPRVGTRRCSGSPSAAHRRDPTRSGGALF